MTQQVRWILTAAVLVAALVLGWLGYLTNGAVIYWATESEVETLGFHVYRATSPEGPWEQVTQEIIPSSGDPFSGSSYQFHDETVEFGQIYYYQLEELESNGTFNRLPDLATFDAGSTLQAWPNIVNWPMVTALIGALAIIWLLPDARRTPAPVVAEQREP